MTFFCLVERNMHLQLDLRFSLLWVTHSLILVISYKRCVREKLFGHAYFDCAASFMSFSCPSYCFFWGGYMMLLIIYLLLCCTFILLGPFELTPWEQECCNLLYLVLFWFLSEKFFSFFFLTYSCVVCLFAMIGWKNGGKPPLTYQSFLKLAGQPSWASSPLTISPPSVPPIGDLGDCEIFEVPTLKELGYKDTEQVLRLKKKKKKTWLLVCCYFLWYFYGK